MIVGMPWYYLVMILLGSGILVTAVKLLWHMSKRDSKIDEAMKEINYSKSKIEKLEEKWFEKTKKVNSELVQSANRVNDIEKTLILMEANQKNLIHSIDTQNKQIIDLIDKLEKVHSGFIESQKLVNEKLQDSISAIKESLISKSYQMYIPTKAS